MNGLLHKLTTTIQDKPVAAGFLQFWITLKVGFQLTYIAATNDTRK